MTKVEATKRTKAHIQYKLQDGSIVPGVTTVLSVLNKPALVKWANNLGLQGIDSTKYVDGKAAIGTLAHQMIADYLKGVETDTSEYSKVEIDQAENAVLAFFDWEKRNPIEPVIVEQPLISEQFRFGGTIDCLGIIRNRLYLPDFKTSSGIFPEMMIQVAAYHQLVIENKDTILTSGLQKLLKDLQVIILRIGRTADEGFEERLINHLDKRWEIFQHALAIYNLQKEVK